VKGCSDLVVVQTMSKEELRQCFKWSDKDLLESCSFLLAEVFLCQAEEFHAHQQLKDRISININDFKKKE